MKNKILAVPSAIALCAALVPLCQARAGLLYEPSSYVQSGLVFQLDGIRNAGALKAHDSDAREWTELISGVAAQFKTVDESEIYGNTDVVKSGEPGWEEDGYRFDGMTYALAGKAVTIPANFTVQVVTDVDTAALKSRYNGNAALSWPAVVGCNEAPDQFVMYCTASSGQLAFKGKNKSAGSLTGWSGKYATAWVGSAGGVFEGVSSSGAKTSYAGGAPGSKTISVGSCYGSSTSGGPYTWFRRTLVGTVKAVRIYNRALEDSELAANRAIDQARFFDGIPVTNVVVATSLPGAEGNEASGAYAIDEDGYVFSAPRSTVVNGTEYICAGCSVETWNGAEWVPSAGNYATSYKATDTTAKVRITWLWAPAGSTSARDIFADAKFKLDIRGDFNENGYIDAGEVGDVFDFSSASPSYATYGAGNSASTITAEQYASGGSEKYGTMPYVAESEVTVPYYPMTTNTAPVLHFTQDSKEENNATYWADHGVRLNGRAVQPGADGAVTIYTRFRWTGETGTQNFVIGNGWNGTYNSENGQSIYLNEKGNIGILVSNKLSASSLVVAKGEWYDLFVTTRNEDVDGEAKAVSDIALCKANPGAKPTLQTATHTSTTGMWFGEKATNIVIGSYLANSTGFIKDRDARAFRGDIADAMIWDRALTDAEKHQVMAGRSGSKWAVGAANSSADEFNGGASSDVEVAEVYLPQSMPWNRMRKALDAAHPGLVLRSPLPAAEERRSMILSVDALLADTGDSAPVQVLVNGSTAGEIDLKRRSFLEIPRSLWVADETSGDVTVELRRTGSVSGAILIDALGLSGSWQAGAEDNSAADMQTQTSAAAFAFAGDPVSYHFTSSLSVGNNSTNYSFYVWVPAGTAADYGWRFQTRVTSQQDNSGLESRHVLLVNGAEVAAHDGKFANGEAFSATIPAGVLHEGLNQVQWVQTLPTRAQQQAAEGKPGIYQFYDFWRMTLVPPPKPFILVVR